MNAIEKLGFIGRSNWGLWWFYEIRPAWSIAGLFMIFIFNKGTNIYQQYVPAWNLRSKLEGIVDLIMEAVAHHVIVDQYMEGRWLLLHQLIIWKEGLFHSFYSWMTAVCIWGITGIFQMKLKFAWTRKIRQSYVVCIWFFRKQISRRQFTWSKISILSPSDICLSQSIMLIFSAVVLWVGMRDDV